MKRLNATFVFVGCVLVGLLLWVRIGEYKTSRRYTHNPPLHKYVENLSASSKFDGAQGLPRELQDLAVGRNCFVTLREKGLVLVYFPIDKGMLGGDGYIYTSRPLRPIDYVSSSLYDKTPKVSVFTVTGLRLFTVESRLNAHWYGVARSHD